MIQEESEVAQPAFKRLRKQTNRYLYKVKNRGGGGFAKEQGQSSVSEATLHQSAIVLQKYMRAYISRRYVWESVGFFKKITNMQFFCTTVREERH